MGESACLMRSYSQPSDVSHESKEGDPFRALTESISFGRFMSESLAWEKWSSFSHNRHLEEVEKFSKPGSVAQKKAYFEAHYRRIAAAKKKAAALLEDANAAANDVTESYITNEAQTVSLMDSESTKSNIHVTIDYTQGSQSPNCNTELVSSGNVNGCNPTVGQYELEKAEIEKAESKTKEHDLVESINKVENQNQLENVEIEDKVIVSQKEKTPIKEDVDQESLASISKKKHTISSSKSSTSPRKSKLPFPAKLTTPVQPRKGINATSSSKKVARETVDKKRSVPKSLHMSINQESLTSISDKKQEISSSNSSVSTTKSKLPFPAKLMSPVQPRKEISVNSSSKKSSRDSVDKKRSIPTSLYMSINLGSHAGEASRNNTPSIAQKFGNSRTLTASIRMSKDSSTSLRTPILASVSRELKHPSVTPKSETRRSRALLNQSFSGSRPADGNWRSSLSLGQSKPSSACESKTRSSTISSPFTFRSEERAAKRKEFYQKMEEKKNSAEAEKVQMQTKSKEKAENGLTKLRQSFALRTKPVADFNDHETVSPSNNRKIPPTHPQSPKFGWHPTTSIAQDTSNRPPRRPSVLIGGSSHSILKNNQIHSFCHLTTKKKTRENASTDILV